MERQEVIGIIEQALREDLGDRGDITTQLTVPEGRRGKGEMIVKEDGVICGLCVAGWVFEVVGGAVLHPKVKDGVTVKSGDVVAIVEGSLSSILIGERTALNFLQRMSGIATLTSKFVSAVNGTGIKILDTRKTTPTLRLLEKYAVRCGGGHNHRFGLFDYILIKDNHIRAAGGITQAVERALMGRPQGIGIEVEVKTIEELVEVLRLDVDRVMLDNFTPEEVRRAVDIIGGKVEVEVSGGISLDNIRDYAIPGVDYISVGRLTHSARALDMSLDIRF